MRYKLLGIQEKETVCDYCHKRAITKAFTVLDTDTGDTLDFGSQCIKKALGVSVVTKLKKDYFEQLQRQAEERYAKSLNQVRYLRSIGKDDEADKLRKEAEKQDTEDYMYRHAIIK